MARTHARFSDNFRESDYLTLASLMGVVSFDELGKALRQCGLATQRHRKLPLEFMVYYVICLSLYSSVSLREVLKCIQEGMRWLKLKMFCGEINGRGGISMARNRLGSEVMEVLFRAICKPLATSRTSGAFYRHWRLVAIDGTTFEVPDEKANSDYFGRPPSSRGDTAFPQLRLTALVETGTHAMIAATHGPYAESENTQAKRILGALSPDMLLLADRGFGCWPFFSEAAKTKAGLLFRIRGDMKFAREKVLLDGSFLSTFYPGADHRKKLNGISVRVVEYTIKGSREKYRLATNILNPEQAPAIELAALYHERREVELAFDELKNHLKLPGANLRSKTPLLIVQELYGYLLAHYTVRTLMHRAAIKEKLDPDELSFCGAVRILQRKITSAHFPPEPKSN